jgi:hypothetical protein
VIIDDTVCVRKMSITSTQIFTTRIDVQSDIVPRSAVIKLLTTRINPDSITALLSPLPPISMKMMFQGRSARLVGLSQIKASVNAFQNAGTEFGSGPSGDYDRAAVGSAAWKKRCSVIRELYGLDSKRHSTEQQ